MSFFWNAEYYLCFAQLEIFLQLCVLKGGIVILVDLLRVWKM